MLHSAVRTTFPFRPWRLLAACLLSAAAAGALGAAYEYRHLGWSDAEAERRVADEVRREFDALTQELDRAAASVAAAHGLIARAARDVGAVHALFDTLDSPARRGVSVTAYAGDGTPLAWSGRPSDLPRARVTGGEALFVAPGSLGPRLVRVHPVTDAAARVGTVVAEAPLPSIGPSSGLAADTLAWNTSLVPVMLRATYEGAGESRAPGVFVLPGTGGRALLEGRVTSRGVEAARRAVRGQTKAAVLGVCAVFLAWGIAPVLSWARRARRPAAVSTAMCLIAGLIAGARGVAWLAVPMAGTVVPMALSGGDRWYTRLWMRSPADFLLSAAAALALVVLAGAAASRARFGLRRARVAPDESRTAALAFVLAHLAGGTAASMWLARYVFIGSSLTGVSAIEWLRFALYPVDGAKTAVAMGLIFWHAAAVWGAATILRLASIWWRTAPRSAWRAVVVAAWAAPAALVAARAGALGPGNPTWVLGPPVVLSMALAWGLPRLLRWRRHSSQAAAFLALFAALALPSVAFYPAAFAQADRATRTLIESDLAPQATRQRDDVQARVRRAMNQVDAVPGLNEFVRGQGPAPGGQVPTEAAFLVWSQTDLAAYRLTSAIELYGGDGGIVSRFALNLPEYTQAQQRWRESGCDWDLFEEVSPFGSEERRLLHAGRALCTEEDGRIRHVGAIVIHAMLDYGSLPFIMSQNPYVELFRDQRAGEADAPDLDVQFTVYGWSLRPIYTSGGAAWTLDRSTFERVYASRTPFWTRQASAGGLDEVYLANDRGGIYALGYRVETPIGHLVRVAELLTLTGVCFVLLAIVAATGFALAGVPGENGRALLQEIRASFYRKLALAFVAVAVIPVLTLAFVSRAYMTGRLYADIEEAAIQTITVAQRFVQDYGRLQERSEGAPGMLTDDVMVEIARVINQDVNVFEGPRLVATSERDLFASGLLATRTPADVYRAVVLDRRASYVGRERVGQFSYIVAAAPVRVSGTNALLTVPLTLRQRAIEREIDDLDRRILLAALAFILLGSVLGYWIAERIADPVNRLQRASARLARGDLSTRVALTSSDELRRLVATFNGMAADLQRQQSALERTHRLEAWADMARQVAHEIKNPLTPIQLSAEHLRRVHLDRGLPLSPVLEDCVESILAQVRLLRQIAGEFSSFATAPTPRPVVTAPADLVDEVVAPYRAGLPAAVSLAVNVPAGLPALNVDRSLVGRALTNVIENSIHAMPSGGTIAISGSAAAGGTAVELRIADTGVGMDESALRRIFEPYFSTKAVGTGLGLSIAKRNVELHGGTIEAESTPAAGTTVTVRLPAGGAPPEHGGSA
ncbi:MAG TPA: HAMP domain-containing sensor histidine kinase [Vicinamibacterales bacterium]|nr:HAMP domain-containing sensor histidine kinase [Vicinamibacterales bacterium]